MRTSLLNLLIAVTSILLVAMSPVYGDPLPPKPMTVDGVEGIWFRAESAKRFLQLDDSVKGLTETIEKQQKIIDLAKQEIDLTLKLRENALEVSALQSKQLGLEVERRQSAESQRDAWYRNPTLWFSTGVMVASGVFIAVSQ